MVQSSYSYTQKGRGVRSAMMTALLAVLAVLFFLIGDLVLRLLGVVAVVFVFSGTYAWFKGEIWTMSIENGVLSWSYARWPSDSGRIELDAVHTVTIDDCSRALTLTFVGGGSRKIKLIGYAYRFRDYLAANYPHIRIKYIETM